MHRLHSCSVERTARCLLTLPGAVGSELGWRGQQGQWWLFSPYLVRGLLLGMEMGVRGVLSCCPASELPAKVSAQLS